MALNTVTLKWDVSDLISDQETGTLTITPNVPLTDSTDHEVVAQQPVQVSFQGGTGQLAGVIANDNGALSPTGSAYIISISGPAGQVLVAAFTAQINFANGAIQWLDQLVPLISPPAGQAYLPLPLGTPSGGQAPLWTGPGEQTTWGTPAGGGGGINPPAGDIGGTAGSPTVVGTHLSSPLPIAQGGTNAATQQAAINSLTGAQTAGRYLRSDGTNAALSTVQSGDLPAATGGAQGAVQLAGDLGGTSSSPQVTGTHLASPLPVAQGGTNSATRNFAGLLTPTAVKTTGYTASPGDFVPCDTTSGGLTVTLPTAPADLTVVGVKHVTQGASNAVTISCAGADVFNKAGGATSASLPLLAQGLLVQYKATGAIWYVVTDDLTLTSLDARHLQVANNLSDLASASTARTNLGLTGAATAALPLSIANGGSGQATQQAAIDALTGTQTTGRYLRSDGTHATLAAIQGADVPTLNQNTTGTAAGLSATLAIGSGGTGQTTQQAAIDALTGTQSAGKYLRSDGTHSTLAVVQAADLPAASTSTQGAVILDGTATDIQAVTTAQAAGVSTKAAAADHAHPLPDILPADVGLIAWTCDPGTANSSVALVSGTVHLIAFWLRGPVTISNIIFQVVTAGATLTASQNFAAILDTGGVQRGITADQSAVWTSTGVKSMALTGAYSAPSAGKYWVAVLSNGTTPPTIRAGAASAVLWNAGLSGASLRAASNGTGQTSMPASVTLSSNSTTNAVTLTCLLS